VTDLSSASSTTSDTVPSQLPRVLGLFDATMVVVGSIIGSGIFVGKVGSVAKALNDFPLIIGIWVAVGVITLCGALALAELCAMIPKAGGPYVYLREAYGPLTAFLWGWTEFWVVRTGSLGALACASAIYLNEVIPMSVTGQELVAIGIVLGLSAINYFSTTQGAWVQNVTAVCKVGFLAGIILLPALLGQFDTANLASSETLRPPASPLSGTWLMAVGAAMMAVLWPYDGWINIGPVAEEIREPQRNLPLGLALGMAVVILVYVGANISYHLTLSMDEVAKSEAIASDVFRKLFGPTGAKIAALGVMISTFGAVNSNMLTGPRIYFAMARDGLLPRALCQVHEAYSTPANAIVIQAIWTVILMVAFYGWTNSPRDTFDGLTDSVILAGLIFYSLTVGAVYVLRKKLPHLPRPYRTWGYPFTPALMLIAYAGVFLSNLLSDFKLTLAVLVLIWLGVFYYYQWGRKLALRLRAGTQGN
jgi:APA family basic amino acid/polyamine antiporter